MCTVFMLAAADCSLRQQRALDGIRHWTSSLGDLVRRRGEVMCLA